MTTYMSINIKYHAPFGCLPVIAVLALLSLVRCGVGMSRMVGGHWRIVHQPEKD